MTCSKKIRPDTGLSSIWVKETIHEDEKALQAMIAWQREQDRNRGH